HDLRPELLADQTGEAFVQSHPDLADAPLAQADRGGQDKRLPVRFEEVDGADIGFKPRLNQPDDVRERFRWVAAVRNEAADFFQRPEERRLVGRGRWEWKRHAELHSKNRAPARPGI